MLILKKDHDPTLPQSDRPISILNTDYKILMSFWANRMNRIVNTYIHFDQSGFLKNRHLQANIRRICNLTVLGGKTHQPGLFYFVDAPKAFDCVEWDFMVAVLSRMGWGVGCIY